MLPAVNHNGASVGSWLGLDSADEAQQSCRVVWHAVIRPTCEMELLDLTDLVCPPLQKKKWDKQKSCSPKWISTRVACMLLRNALDNANTICFLHYFLFVWGGKKALCRKARLSLYQSVLRLGGRLEINERRKYFVVCSHPSLKACEMEHMWSDERWACLLAFAANS